MFEFNYLFWETLKEIVVVAVAAEKQNYCRKKKEKRLNCETIVCLSQQVSTVCFFQLIH